MNFFEPQTKVIDLGGGNLVTVKKPTVKDRNESIAIAEQASGGGVLAMGPLLQQELLKRMIIRWEGPGFGGVEAKPAAIDNLPSEVSDQIAQGATDFIQGLSDAEKKESTPDEGTSS